MYAIKNLAVAVVFLFISTTTNGESSSWKSQTTTLLDQTVCEPTTDTEPLPPQKRFTETRLSYGDWTLVRVLDAERYVSSIRIEYCGELRWQYGGNQSGRSKDERNWTYHVQFMSSQLVEDWMEDESRDQHPGAFSSGQYWRGEDGSKSGVEVEDLTGRGGLTVIAYEWTGGAHAAFNYWILDLRDTGEVHQLAYLPLGNATMSIADVNEDGVAEISTVEDAFAYWGGSFASSCFPSIELSWDGKQWLVANKPLSDKEKADYFQSAASPMVNELPSMILQPLRDAVINLLWHGHVAEAMDIIHGNREVFLDAGIDSGDWWLDMQTTAATSIFWPELCQQFPQLSKLPDLD